jgi:Fe2+ or Zn2+ uptake regulation protein
MSHTLWILEATDSEKFPYLLTITQDERILLRLWVQERWPGQKGNVFCILAMLREAFPDAPEATIRRALRVMKKEDIITPHGRGKKSYWRKTAGRI